MTKTEEMEALEMARELIQEAKGADGPNGGFVTDHLDAAEGWLDKVEAALSRRPTVPEGLVEEADQRLCFGSMAKHEVYLAGRNEALATLADEQIESILSLHRYDTEDDRKRAGEAIRIFALRSTPAPDALREKAFNAGWDAGVEWSNGSGLTEEWEAKSAALRTEGSRHE